MKVSALLSCSDDMKQAAQKYLMPKPVQVAINAQHPSPLSAAHRGISAISVTDGPEGEETDF